MSAHRHLASSFLREKLCGASIRGNALRVVSLCLHVHAHTQAPAGSPHLAGASSPYGTGSPFHAVMGTPRGGNSPLLNPDLSMNIHLVCLCMCVTCAGSHQSLIRLEARGSNPESGSRCMRLGLPNRCECIMQLHLPGLCITHISDTL